MAVHNHVYRSNLTWCLPWNNVLVMRKGLYSVYRLAVDAKPVGWWCSRLKISELAQGFSDGYAINGSQRHSHQQQGVYLGFCESLLPQIMSVGKSTPPCYVFSTTTSWYAWQQYSRCAEPYYFLIYRGWYVGIGKKTLTLQMTMRMP